MRTYTYILLVGLLTVLPLTASAECIKWSKAIDGIITNNPLAITTDLKGKVLASFVYNYNNDAPITSYNITNVAVVYIDGRPDVFIAFAIDGCLKTQGVQSLEWLKKMLENPTVI
tara:strand:- start:346 stop:690 length:345 start_codon:yes stop_codon:yes gene_type:complete